MACGVDGTNGVARVCSVNGGSTMTFEYRDWPDDASRGSIDISHKGPCAVYLKKVDSAVTDSGTGTGWFKIWDEGYDEDAGKWCTEKIIDNNGHLFVDIPDTLQGGYYLVRPELLALHNADKTPSDPQFYVGCAQVFLKSSGTSTPDAADIVSIPGYVEAGDASVTFNIWQEPMALPYPIPGPVVYNAASNGVSRVAKTNLRQTEGLEVSNCVLENANWCGVELAKYSTQDACWSASTVCWNQCTDCYSSAPPTGSSNCKIWEAKCQTIDDQCNAGNYDGPPNYMKILTPAKSTISVPAAEAAQTGDGSYLPAASANADSSSVATTTFSQAMSSAAVSSYDDSDQTSWASSSMIAISSDTHKSSTTLAKSVITSAVAQAATSVIHDTVTVEVTVYATQTPAAKRGVVEQREEEQTSQQINPRWSAIQAHANWHKKFGHRRVRKSLSQHEHELVHGFAN